MAALTHSELILEKERQNFVRRSEYRIKKYSCEQSMVDLALLIFLDSDDRSKDQYGMQLCERAIKQHNSASAMCALAQHFYLDGTTEQKQRVIPLLEASVKLHPSKETLYFLGKVLFYGKFGQTDRLRGTSLLQRALKVGEDYIVMGSLAKMYFLHPNPVVKKKEALQMFKRAIEIGNDPYHMRQLARLYETGTPVLKACERCRLKWTQRADECEQNGGAW